MLKLLTKFLGSKNERTLRKMRKVIEKINALENEIKHFSDDKLQAQTGLFRNRLEAGQSLIDILPEAFATVREASKRVFNMRHFDVQLIGGLVLNDRCIAEMRTGEGKTLTATLPAYLNALTGFGVHIITVNDYLALRDADNNRPLFEFLNMQVGLNLSGMSPAEKKLAYAADITYGTNNEFAFDYLRDNMVFNPEQRVQGKLYYALIDEVDSILIDEARTPLIISGPAEDSSTLYQKINTLVPLLLRQEKEDTEDFQGEGDFFVDEKSRQAYLTERGLELVEKLLIEHNVIQENEALYSATHIILMHHVTAALRAHTVFTRDVDYIIHKDEIVIVDEHTGRTMPGRRWSDGLHQAIEAKEGVEIQNENQTLASITFQNYFRLYQKLAGMTGTADTEAFEFKTIYNLDTVVIPTNKKMVRIDKPDLIYMTEKEKFEAIIEDIKSCHAKKQPVLVGTISIEKSETLSHALNAATVKHKVLNAKFHAEEAEIIAQAGQPGAITIATNMAGRGTDIVLGGNWQREITLLTNPTEENIENIKDKWQKNHEVVLAAGGLHIIGTERHESRRIDNQLRGRAGRQGDVGSSRFYLSLEDQLMRIFTSDRVIKMMHKLGMNYGEAIEHPWITKAIANAQSKVEARNFDIRKQLLEYDDVANDQRQAIYNQRNELLNGNDISETIKSIRYDVFNQLIEKMLPADIVPENWDIDGLEQHLANHFALPISIHQWLKEDSQIEPEKILNKLLFEAEIIYESKKDKIGMPFLQNFEKSIMLQTLDNLWKEHLAAMDYLRQGIHLRGYAQKDPKQEYKRESFSMFSTMLETLKHNVISILSKLEPYINPQIENNLLLQESAEEQSNTQQQEKWAKNQEALNSDYIFSSIADKSEINRNSPCPCGSNKKYKFCHGVIKRLADQFKN